MQKLNVSARQQKVSPAYPQLVGEGQHPAKMQGHWVLARAGKRVLRPGGLELTRGMLDALAIGPEDRVVEFAPGLGITAKMILQCRPAIYWGVEREPAAEEYLQQQLSGTGAQIVQSAAEESGLLSASASVVYGEVMLSMQSPEQKNRIFAEARRLLAAGGRYGIHELCFLPDDISGQMRREIQAAFSKEIHVGVQPLSRSEWIEQFERNGMKVIWCREAPMHLLEPRRMLRDEGWRGSLRIAFNVIRDPVLRRRILAMRELFRRYKEHVGAISLVGRREPDNVSFLRPELSRAL
jgi:hypothetical protein